MMPNSKRGVTYVDWAVSFGLFIITIIFVLILIKPRAQTSYDKEDLLSLTESAFMNVMNWEVKQVPVIIEKLQPMSPTPTIIQIDYGSDVSLEYDLPSQYEEVGTHPLRLRCTGPDTASCSPTSFQLKIAPIRASEATPNLKLTCSTSNPAVCDALLGTTETVTGLHEQKITAFRALDYASQRQALSLPGDVDVAITVDGTQVTNNDQPPLQTNVYAREIKTWTLDADAETTPTLVVIRAWR